MLGRLVFADDAPLVDVAGRRWGPRRSAVSDVQPFEALSHFARLLPWTPCPGQLGGVAPRMPVVRRQPTCSCEAARWQPPPTWRMMHQRWWVLPSGPRRFSPVRPAELQGNRPAELRGDRPAQVKGNGKELAKLRPTWSGLAVRACLISLAVRFGPLARPPPPAGGRASRPFAWPGRPIIAGQRLRPVSIAMPACSRL